MLNISKGNVADSTRPMATIDEGARSAFEPTLRPPAAIEPPWNSVLRESDFIARNRCSAWMVRFRMKMNKQINIPRSQRQLAVMASEFEPLISRQTNSNRRDRLDRKIPLSVCARSGSG